MNMQERLDSPFAYHLDPRRHEAITGCGAWRPVLRGLRANGGMQNGHSFPK
jgi:hypothetical protein